MTLLLIPGRIDRLLIVIDYCGILNRVLVFIASLILRYRLSLMLMIDSILLVHIWLLVLLLDHSFIGILLLTRIYFVFDGVMFVFVTLLFFRGRGRSHKDFYWFVLCVYILSILLILLHLITDLGSHIFQVRWKLATWCILILTELTIARLLWIILLAYLLGFGSARWRVLQYHVGSDNLAFDILSTSITLEILLSIYFCSHSAMIVVFSKLPTWRISTVLAMLSLLFDLLSLHSHLLLNVVFISYIDDHGMLIMNALGCFILGSLI